MQYRILPSENDVVEMVRKYGCDLTIQNLLVKFNDTKLQNRMRLQRLITVAFSTTIPIFPIRGQDLVDLGYKGKIISTLMEQLELEWVESIYSLSKDEMLNLVRRGLYE